MSKPKYTIADLIAELAKFPQDMPVITNGYEGEYENISLPICLCETRRQG